MDRKNDNGIPATKEDIDRVVELIIQLHQELDRRFEAVDRRFEAVDRRFEAVDRRLDRMNEALASIQAQMAAMTRWGDRLDRDNEALLATQSAQQRAIDDLAARVTKLETRQQ